MADFLEWLESASDTECKQLAEKVAREVGDFYHPDQPLEAIRFGRDNYMPEASHWVDAFLAGRPVLTDEDAQRITGLVNRMRTAKYWARRFRTESLRLVEQREIGWGYIGRDGAYISRRALERVAYRKQQSDAAIASAVVMSPEGLEFELQKIIDASLSNPKNRRIELIVRMKGGAEWAQRAGWIGYAITLTAPSKFHRLKTVGRGENKFLVPNDNWAGATPRDTANYLRDTWAQCRAALAKAGLPFAGLRTAEPHKDGTPHWHLVMFFKPEHAAQILKTIRHYFIRLNPDERGARERRVKFERIRTSKGRDLAYAAVAYAIGYISKNIDGAGVAGDTEAGIDAINGAQRATAWARVWGIRQFQTYGFPSITPYREARRINGKVLDDLLQMVREGGVIGSAARGLVLGNAKPLMIEATAAMRGGHADVLAKLTKLRDLHLADKIEVGHIALGEMWKAADQGQFRRYIDAQLRAPVELLKEERTNAFGETVKVIRGLISADGVEVLTREEGWAIKWGKNAPEGRSEKAQPSQPRTCGNNCNQPPAGMTWEHVESAEAGAIRVKKEGEHWRGGGHYERRQAGIEEFSRDLMRQGRAIRQNTRKRGPIYSFFEG